MKIFISQKVQSGPWGGGNQFLKALRGGFAKKNVHAESFAEAAVVLFDSYQNIFGLLQCWFFNNKKIRVYRLGPIFHLHRSWKWRIIDVAVVIVANICADVVIFQSQWSYRQAQKLGFWNGKKKHIITNAVDTAVFFEKAHGDGDTIKPIQLVYTSWSSNKNKGFEYLNFLDERLDFQKYQFTFIGNTSVIFKNIKTIPPLSSGELADELRKRDIFVSPVKDDACSNAILEALSCGLPVVALNSGGNPEIVGEGGALFDNEQEMLEKIDTVAKDIVSYGNKINVKSIDTVAQEYVDAIRASIKNV